MNTDTIAVPVIDTITFVGFAEEFVGPLRESFGVFAEDPKLEALRDYFIVSAMPHGSYPLQHFTGIDMAIEMVNKNPDMKLILGSVLPLDYLRRLKPNVDILMRRENSRYIEFPCNGARSLIDLVNESGDNEVDNPRVLADFALSKVRTIMHGIEPYKVPDPYNPANEAEKLKVDTAIKEAREFFAVLVGVPDEKVLTFIIESAKGREEVMKGEYLTGVFCDVEGTILKDGNIQQKTLDMLAQYEGEGKTVTVWTDGDTDHLTSELRKKGLDYQVRSKADFAGATVEIAIDDMDEFAFTALTRIQAKNFVRV